MEIHVESISSSKQRITITVDAERVKKGRDKLYSEVKKFAQVRGFRPGKAPRSLLERHYGEKINEELKGDLLKESLEKAVEDHKLRLAAQAEIESAVFGDDGTFSAVATVEVFPEIVLSEYKGLKVKRRRVSVREEDVEESLRQFAQMRAIMKTVEEARPATEKDHAEIDYRGTAGGKELHKDENYLMALNSDSVAPGLCAHVIGMTAGEEKDIEVVLPENFSKKEFAGQTAKYHLRLKSIKERIVPELNDDFARDVSPDFQSLEDLRARERDGLEKHLRDQAKGFDRAQIIEALCAAHDFEAPGHLVDKQAKAMADNYLRDLSYYGIQKKQLDSIADETRDRMRPDALKEVKGSLIFEAVAKAEGIDATPEDLTARYEELAGHWGKSAIEISAEFQKNDRLDDLKAVIREEKTIAFLLEHAEAEWVDPPVDGGESGSEGETGEAAKPGDDETAKKDENSAE